MTDTNPSKNKITSYAGGSNGNVVPLFNCEDNIRINL